jgi:ABC-type branched-subunit amino acid transport system substrate-binding protein
MHAFGAAVLGVALVAAACGGDDDGSGATAATTPGVNAGSSTTAAAAAGGSTTPTTAPPAQPTTMDAWEAQWAQERDAMVARAKSEGIGKSADGKSVKGPAGFTLDLSKCPAGWSDTEGLTDTEIRFGEVGAASGTLADSYSYYKSINVLLDHYSDAGAFKDSNGKTRKVHYIFKDDAYDPAKTIPLVDEFIDSEKVFAMQTLGTPNTMKVYDKLNQRCIPNPWAITAHPAWNDPVNHPWTTGLALTYSTEAVLWGAFVEEHIDEFPDGVKVAALVMNNDFGKVYDATFKAYIAQSPHKDKIEYVTETIEPAAVTVTNEMTTLAAEDPDVFIMMLAGTACAQTVVEVSQNGMKDNVKYLFDDQPCGNNATMGKDKVGGDGSAAEGWWLVGGGARDLTDPSQADLPYVKFLSDLLRAKGIDPKSSGNLNGGAVFAWPLVQALIVGGQLPGGLTRTNFVLAQRMLDMTHPFVFEGIKLTTNGNEDAFPIEGGVYQTYNATKQAFERRSEIINLNGKSKPCAWDQGSSTCK